MSEDGRRPDVAQEHDRVPGRPAAAWVAGTAAAIVALGLVSWGALRFLAATPSAAGEPGREASPPPPGALDPDQPDRLPFTTGTHRTAPDSADLRRLTTYGWVDRDGGVVRVPVERAMGYVAELGLRPRAPEGARPHRHGAPSADSSAPSAATPPDALQPGPVTTGSAPPGSGASGDGG